VASERGVELRVSDDTVLIEKVLEAGDLITLVGNLIDNALDAAAVATGERWVAVSVTAGDELVVRVRDSGAGVPAALLDRVFEEGFSTKSRSGGRRRGIGLALAREMARNHGGEIAVANEAGAGAVFTARLPLRVAARR
jgi:two-component system CitB family sensor kinase